MIWRCVVACRVCCCVGVCQPYITHDGVCGYTCVDGLTAYVVDAVGRDVAARGVCVRCCPAWCW